MESLEARVLPAIRTWDGGAALNDRWTDRQNWAGNDAPVAGDDLVFPPGVGLLDRSTRNDFAADTLFNSITIQADGYKLTGNRVQLGGDLEFNATGSKADVEFDIRLPAGVHEFNVAVGPTAAPSTLNIKGAITSGGGTGSLRLVGGDIGNIIRLGGSTANTFNRQFEVSGVQVKLDKSNNTPAISGALVIDGTTGRVQNDVNFGNGRVGQFAPGTPVTINGVRNISFIEDAPLVVTQETLGALTLNGAVVTVTQLNDRNPGTLTLNGAVDAGGQSVIANFAPRADVSKTSTLVMSGSFGSRDFRVNSGGNLRLRTQVTGGTLVKQGLGELVLDPAAGGLAQNAFAGLTIEDGSVVGVQSDPGELVLPQNIVIGGFAGTQAAELRLGVSNGMIPSNASIVVRSGGTFRSGGSRNTISRLELNSSSSTAQAVFDGAAEWTITNDIIGVGAAAFARISANAKVTVGDDVSLSAADLIVEGGATLTIGDELRLRGSDVLINADSSIVLGDDLDALADDAASRITGAGTLFLTLGSHTFNIADGAAGVDLELAALIRTDPTKDPGSASVIKQGPGRLLLTGTDLHGGPTSIAAGEFRLNGVLQNSQLGIASGARLSGIGQARNVVAFQGSRVEPGQNGVGQLRAANVSLLFGSTYAPQLVSTTSFDQLQVQSLFLDEFLDDVGVVRHPVLDVQSTFAAPLNAAFKLIDVTGTAPNAPNRIFETPAGVPLPDGAGFIINGQTFTIDYDGGDGNDVVITRNSPPAFENRTLTPRITEGGTATLTGRITEADAGDTFILNVDWGDGVKQTFTFPPGSSRDVSVQHRYLDDPASLTDHRFLVKLSWRDQRDGGNEGTESILVINDPPSFTRLTAARTGTRQFDLSGLIADAGVRDAHRVQVQWEANGAFETLNLPAGQNSFTLRHRYARAGVKQITVLLFDDDLGFTIRRLTVTA